MSATRMSARPQPQPPSHQRRFARRSWRHRLRRARPWIVAALLTGAVAALVWVVFFSTVLPARSVEVVGGTRIPAAEIVRVADVPLGGPLARVDLDVVERRVDGIPAVAEAAVSRGWPDAVRIEVTDRVPVAAVSQRGSWRLVDADGFTWGRSASPPRGLPVVRTTGTGVRPAAVTEAARVVTSLPGRLAADVDAVRVRTIDQITLDLAGGPTVQWGSAEQSALKAEVLATMLASDEALLIGEGEDAQPAGQVDVTVPSQPTVRR